MANVFFWPVSSHPRTRIAVVQPDSSKRLSVLRYYTSLNVPVSQGWAPIRHSPIEGVLSASKDTRTTSWLDTLVLALIFPRNSSLLVVVQSFSHAQLFATPWTSAHQASLSITNSRSLLKFMSIESVMPSSHLLLCHPLLLLPSIFSNIRVLTNELSLPIKWPKYWSFIFSIGPSNE